MTEEAKRAALGILWGALYIGGYFAINRLFPFENTAARAFGTRFDAMIPFVPELVWPYLLFLLPLTFAPFFVVESFEEYKAVVRAYAAMTLVSFAAFLVVPVRMERPEPDPARSFSEWTVLITFTADNPVNCFPSLHVGLSMLSAWILGSRRGLWRSVAPIAAALIAISVLAIKQHYIADLLAGAALATACYGLLVRPVQIAEAQGGAPATAAARDE